MIAEQTSDIKIFHDSFTQEKKTMKFTQEESVSFKQRAGLTPEDFYKLLSGCTPEALQSMLNTDVPISPGSNQTLKLGELLARHCIDTSRLSVLSKEDRAQALLTAKGILAQLKDSTPSIYELLEESE
jgi:hypothetical protein